MGIFSFFSGKKSERVIVLHIGSATVAAAYADIQDGTATLRASVSTNIGVLPSDKMERFEKEMHAALKTTLDSLSAQHLPSPDRVAVYLSSPWYASQVRVAKVSRQTSFVVTRNFLSDMVNRELAAFEDEEITRSHESGNPLRAIESKIMLAKLNGYATAEPIGMSARELEFSIFLSVASEKLLSHLEDTIGKSYHKPISFGTFAAASMIVARDFFPHYDDYLLIDVGGEVTDITLVRESAPVRSVSFPAGRNMILRKLSEKLSRSIPESLALCTLYAEDKVEESMKTQCAAILKEAKDEWLESFQRAVFTNSSELSIPDTVLLSAGSDIAPWFIETIRREEFHQHALTAREFKVVLLDAGLFHESLQFAEGVPREPCIMIDTLATAKH